MIALLTVCLLFSNSRARAELHQQKHARKLCSATLNRRTIQNDTQTALNEKNIKLNKIIILCHD